MAKRNRLRSSASSGMRKNIGKKIGIFLGVVVLAALVVGGLILFEFESPQVTLERDINYLGSKSTLPVTAVDRKSGLRSISISLRQKDVEQELFRKEFPRQAWFSQAGPREFRETVVLDLDRKGFRDGEAELTVEVRDFSLNGMFAGNGYFKRLVVNIDTKPPKITLEHAQRYIRPGGSGMVLYRLGEEVERHGVMIDDTFFPGYPVAEEQHLFIAYLALPWDSGPPENTRIIAVDRAGNQAKAIFSMKYKKTRFKQDRINITDGFLKRKMPEFEEHYPDLQGSLLEKYLVVNNKIRKENAETIAKLCANPLAEQLWNDRFLRMAGASRAGFADQRTYYYKGKAIDRQTHLGMDIASTARVAIKAANRGKVIFADYLGIYGNTVILDHGQGIFSLYSHLSRIDTTPGTTVEKGEVIARSGATGMAGGDHLHFSMLVHGIFVTPVEWWDQHWIDVNISSIVNDVALR